MKKKVIIIPKHREVLKMMGDNGGMSRTEAMIQKNYSPSYADGGKIADTDSWQELMKTYLPDDLLAKRHKELLNKREVVKEYSHEQGEYVQRVTDQPETNAVKAGLDMGYRLKGKYAPEKHFNVNIPVPLLGGDSIKHENLNYENSSNREIAKSD